MGWTVRYHRAIVIGVLFTLLSSSIACAHDQKEYNILIKENGLTPPSVNQGVLVETDTLFFRNVDNRENVTHRILVDADQDGYFRELMTSKRVGCQALVNLMKPVKKQIQIVSSKH